MSDDELAEGNLRDRLRACQQAGLPGIPVPELLSYVREVAEALDSLHDQRQLYRDVKPDTILLFKGHAQLAAVGQGLATSVRVVAVGTPVYMAPEVWRDMARAQSDQYSLASSYAELRLGRRLVSGPTMVEIMVEHLERTPDLAPLPELEQQVLRKALSKDPEQRYPSCLSFAQELERVVVH